PRAAGLREHHTIIPFRRLHRNGAFARVAEHALGIARERIAVAAAARRIQPKHVARLQRIIRVAGRQALGAVGVRVDPDVAAPAGRTARASIRRDAVLHRADREARIGEVEIFAADAQAAAVLAGAAGIPDQLEAHEAGGKFALDDFHRRDLGVALVDGDAGNAVLVRARAAAAGDDLVLHIALSRVGAAAA